MDRILCITGGSRGIGAATARLAARQGYAVAVGYLGRRDAAEALVAQIVANGGVARALQVDVALEASVEAFFAAVDRALGPLTALVNNAGVLDTQCRLEDMDAARLQRVFATNVTGSFLCAREAARHMIAAGRGGAIVFTASIMGLSGGGFGGNVNYQASKGGVVNLARGLAVEWAPHRIRVNAVAPGWVRTPFIGWDKDPGRLARLADWVPLGRLAEAEEIAPAIVFLAGPGAAMITGHTLPVDGGFLAK